MKLFYRVLTVAGVLVCVSCSQQQSAVSPDIISQVQAAYQNYTGKAPGTPIVTGMATSLPFPQNYAQDMLTLQGDLAARIASAEASGASTVTMDDLVSLYNALDFVTQINAQLDNPPPALLISPPPSTRAIIKSLRRVQRQRFELIGEQASVGIAAPTTTLPAPDPGTLASIQDHLLYEANKAIVNGETHRADVMRLDAVTLGNYAQEVGTDSSVQPEPIPNPTTEVPEVFDEEGILASVAEIIGNTLKFVDPNDSVLPADCTDSAIDEDTCTIQPVVIIFPSDPIPTQSGTDDIPSSLAAAANNVIAKTNAAVQSFISTPQSGPMSSTLAPQVGTLEVETAQILVDLNLISDSVNRRQFIAKIQTAQGLIGVLAALLNLPAPTDPGTVSAPDLDAINPSDIPSAPATAFTAPPFGDTRTPAYTLQQAIIDGMLRAERLAYQIVGENIQTLHGFADASVTSQVIVNYESAAKKADNAGEPDRAALLRIIKIGYALCSANPVALPLPATSSLIQNQLSQAGFAATLAIAVNTRRRAVDANEGLIPSTCDDETFDSDTCPLIP